MITHLRQVGAVLAFTVALAGCPLARPREVDCQSVRTSLAQVDARLAPYGTATETMMTVEQSRAWADALGLSVADMQQQVRYVAARDVVGALEHYRDALGSLRAHVSSRGAYTRESGPGETLRLVRELGDVRTRVNGMCPASTGR